MIERPIVIKELEDVGISLPMWGRFANNELTFAIAIMPSGAGRSWQREARESADVFSARISRDVCERVYADKCPVLLTG